MLPLALLLVALPVFGEQTYVTRYDLFTGYTFLDSPRIDLFENGFHLQAGFRPRTWYSVGFDYSVSAGDLRLTPDLLPTDLQQRLAAQLGQLAAAGRLPAGYSLVVPAHSVTQTFAVGPQLAFRHWEQVTLFLRPNLGAIHEVATPKPGDPIATGIVQQLAPAGKKTDWTPVYGFGGGFDYLFSKHVAVRFQADLVYDHLFNDILKDGRWTVRFSVGPCFNFGRNIAK
ncbi:MAG TPA: hypothetical protein VFA33_27005 [Bryobacteraceae bacterium]|nr:hypothetical protein [Bryobacteraceae bacterium]